MDLRRSRQNRGRTITYEEFLNSPYEYAPNVEKLTLDGPSSLPADADGRYPVPQPGIVTETEYMMPGVTPAKKAKGKGKGKKAK